MKIKSDSESSEDEGSTHHSIAFTSAMATPSAAAATAVPCWALVCAHTGWAHRVQPRKVCVAQRQVPSVFLSGVDGAPARGPASWVKWAKRGRLGARQPMKTMEASRIAAHMLATPPSVAVDASSAPVRDWETRAEGAQLACPLCHQPLQRNQRRWLQCPCCKQAVPAARDWQERGYFDLMPERFAAGRRDERLRPVFTVRQDLFRTPFVAYLYERGWRDQFQSYGFPGPDEETRLALAFFGRDARRVMDLSCGSGLMARRLVRSGPFDSVVAVDYSEAMLQETVERAARERVVIDGRSVRLLDRLTAVVRADVAHLPFATESLDGVHAGAALHCWPCVQDGLAEVHRVLKRGDGTNTGRFFATTFLWAPSAWGSALRVAESAPAPAASYRFFDERELEWLVRAAGFRSVDVQVRQRCAIIRAEK